eukprot:2024904-Pyramimonas_sp.AAC.1
MLFMLENASGLARSHKRDMDAIIALISDVKTASGQSEHKILHATLDTKLHGGLPQSRPRVYAGALPSAARPPP